MTCYVTYVMSGYGVHIGSLLVCAIAYDDDYVFCHVLRTACRRCYISVRLMELYGLRFNPAKSQLMRIIGNSAPENLGQNVDRCRNYGEKSKFKMAAVRHLGFSKT